MNFYTKDEAGLAQHADKLKADFLFAIQANEASKKLGEANTTASILMDAVCDDDLARGLVRAMSLTMNGKYEAGSKALLEWLEEVGKAYGRNVAELQA